jgi:hypothetical protein
MQHVSEPPNPWLGYRRCLSDLPDSSYLLVLQEDTLPCQNFAAVLDWIVAREPRVPVVLFLAYLPRRIATLALRAANKRERYVDTQLRINDFMPIVAVLWPTEKAREFMEWTAANPNRLGHPHPRSDDGVAGRWCALTKQTVRFTVPSLVEHPDLEPSLIGRKPAWGKDKSRVALMLPQGDPLALGW